MSKEQCHRAQWPTPEPGGTHRGANKGILRPRIHLFRGFRILGPLLFSLHPFRPIPNISVVSKSLVLLALECRRDVDFLWVDRNIGRQRMAAC